jgi:hypothetical protein
MADAVKENRVESGIGQEDFPDIARRRVSIKDDPDIFN